MRLILSAPLVLLLGAAVHAWGWWRGYRAGHASASKTIAGDLGQQMQRWKSGDVVKNRDGVTLDISGIRERAK